MQEPNRTHRKGDHGRSNRSLFRRTIFLMVVLGVILSDEPLTPEVMDEIVESSAKQLLRLPKKKSTRPKTVTRSEAEAAFFG